MDATEEFWTYLDRLVAGSRLVIEQRRGTADPSHPALVYPADYGYLEGTCSPDREGIDVWVGGEGGRQVRGIVCTVDLAKRDSEVKLLVGCSDEEMRRIASFQCIGAMRGLLVSRRGRSQP